MGEEAHVEVSEVSTGPLGLLLLTLMVMGGSAFVYAFVVVGELIAIEVGLLVLILAIFCSLAYAIVAPRDEAVAGGAIALASAVSVVTILLPSTRSIYIDAAIVLAVSAVAIVAFSRSVRLPTLPSPQLGRSAVAVVLLLPVLLALAEALFLGLRFAENYPLGTPLVMFTPLIALFGYVEEALFRGVVQRSLAPLTGTSVAIMAGAFLDASYMMFWGSIMYGAFAFLTSMLLGALYARSHSLMYVGTLRALQDTWLIIVLLVLQMVAL